MTYRKPRSFFAAEGCRLFLHHTQHRCGRFVRAIANLVFLRRRPCCSGRPAAVWAAGILLWKRSHGRTTKAPPDERGGNRYVRPKETAPHLDSTSRVALVASAPRPVILRLRKDC